MAEFVRVRFPFGTRAEIDTYQTTVAAEHQLAVGDFVYIDDEGVIARITSTTTPGTSAAAIGGGSGGGLPAGAVTDDVPYVSGAAFARNAALGFNPATSTFRAPKWASTRVNAGLVTPGAVAAAWQPSITGRIIQASISATCTLNQPTTAIPSGADLVVEAELQVTNADTARPQKLVLGTLPLVAGSFMPDMVIPKGGVWYGTLQRIGTDGWRLKGRNAVLAPIEFLAGFGGEPIPVHPVAIIERTASRDIFVPGDFAFLGAAETKTPRTGASFTLALERWNGSSQDRLATCTFAQDSTAGVFTVGASFPNGDTIAKGQTYRVVMDTPTGTTSAENLRGHFLGLM